MRVLLIQENGRHAANRNFRECFSMQRSFVLLGHECHVWGLGHPNFDSTPEWESYDWIVNLENYDESGWVPSLRGVRKPQKFLWSIDAHCRGEEIYDETFRKGNYDVLLHSTRDFVKKDYHLWFPNAFDDTLIKPVGVVRVHHLGFCGNWANRRPVLEWMRDNHGLHLDIFVIGHAMVMAINTYRIHFNLNIGVDVNYRSFETIGCGTLLLTNHNQQYADLGFKDGVNCLMYRNHEELADIITTCRTRTDIESIATNGLDLSRRHSYTMRIGSLIEAMSGRRKVS